MDAVRNWLESLGLGQYADAFEHNDLEEALIPELTDEYLQALGVVSVGHRMKLLKAARAFVSTVNPSPLESGSTRASVDSTEDAERRQLTIMFADLVGSTEMSRRLDAEDLRAVNRTYQDAAKSAIESHGGYVARYMGDGVLAYFGYPQAHEDDAERALRAGIELTESIPSLQTEVELAVRVGIATGPVVVGDIIGEGAAQESAVVGETPNLAARLQAQAEPNTVVISAATQVLTSGLFELEALEPQVLKGFGDSVSAFRVRAEAEGQSRFAARSGAHLSPFSGRDEERELLSRRWTRACTGEGQVILVAGEPGIGKSRLLQQLQADVSGRHHERIFLQCSPYHEASPLYPTIAAFGQALRFSDTPTDPDRLSALDAHLQQLGIASTPTLGLLAHLLSIATENKFPEVEAMDTRELREQTLRTLVDYFRRRTERAPLLCIFEDVHWADPTTKELLGQLVEAVASLSALIVVSTRAGFEAGWTDLPHVRINNLSRLGPDASSQILSAASGAVTLPDEVAEAVLERAEGNPLFIEELTRTMAQSAGAPDERAAIPATLQDSLMARLDASRDGKAVAQCASVIGRVFEQPLLAKVWEGSAERLASGLESLDAAKLVSKVSGEGALVRYTFKHALVRDAAYDSLLRERRAHLHGRVASAFEALSQDTRTSQPELLAQHYAQAGLARESIDCYLLAARRANQHSNCAESLAQSSAGLALLTGIPDQGERSRLELGLQFILAEAARAFHGESAEIAGTAYARAADLSEGLHDPRNAFRALEGLARFHRSRLDRKEARAATKRMLEIGRAYNDALLWASGYTMVASDNLHAAKLVASRDSWELALAKCSEIDPNTVAAMATPVDFVALRGLGWNYANLGYFDKSLEASTRLVRLAESRSNTAHICEALWVLGGALLMRLDYADLGSHADRLLQLASSHGLRFHQGMAELHQGVSMAGLGDLSAGIAHIERAQSEFQTIDHPMGLSHVRWSPYAVFLANAGRFDDAVEFATDGLAALRGTLFESWALMRLGEVWRLAGAGQSSSWYENSEDHLTKAVTLAQTLDAKGWELEAAISLAKLWRDAGKQEEASSLLKAAYDWFEEGHDCGLLRSAKAVLDSLDSG